MICEDCECDIDRMILVDRLTVLCICKECYKIRCRADRVKRHQSELEKLYEND